MQMIRKRGVRTYGAVALGSCIFALIASHVTGGNNAHMIPAGVVTGIGFLGAGSILRVNGKISG
jgi:putative Mg2+ transporter-C (MgtC) family protein